MNNAVLVCKLKLCSSVFFVFRQEYPFTYNAQNSALIFYWKIVDEACGQSAQRDFPSRSRVLVVTHSCVLARS